MKRMCFYVFYMTSLQSNLSTNEPRSRWCVLGETHTLFGLLKVLYFNLRCMFHKITRINFLKKVNCAIDQFGATASWFIILFLLSQLNSKNYLLLCSISYLCSRCINNLLFFLLPQVSFFLFLFRQKWFITLGIKCYNK